MLILGAGPVGLELAGETREVRPDKHITVVDPGTELLPGFLPEVRADLVAQLGTLGIEVLLGTELTTVPPGEPGDPGTFTLTTDTGRELTADIWFRAHGTRINSDYLADGRLTPRTPAGAVPVTEHLSVAGHDHVYAVGDINDLDEAKMAGYAGQHAAVVAANIKAQLGGGSPAATYTPLGHPMILLPLGTRAGVGQLPSDTGPSAASVETVSVYKGTDLFTARFTEQFGVTPGAGTWPEGGQRGSTIT